MDDEINYFFTPYALFLLPRKCHDEFFVKLNIMHVPCLKIALTKILGYGIVVGSSIVKIPQIIKVLQARSVVGLSLLSLILELLALLFTTSYSIHQGFPFSAWGESFLMSIQDAALILMFFYFSGSLSWAFIFLPVYLTGSYILCSGMTPSHILEKLQACCVIIMASSKLLQVIANFRNGHTGQLSAITIFLLFAGSLARIFTTIQETDDKLFLIQFLTAFALNCTLMGQVAYYWNVQPLKEKNL